MDLEVRGNSEFVLQRTITPGEVLQDDPFGDHIGCIGSQIDRPK
ncbi:UbiD family decarboxylase domain-containing protein [Limnospira platensis CENA597]